jgi:hypothetical protein
LLSLELFKRPPLSDRCLFLFTTHASMEINYLETTFSTLRSLARWLGVTFVLLGENGK